LIRDCCEATGDCEAILAAITPQTRLIFIANPNNPTGTLLQQETINAFMARVPNEVVVVFDEAYFEYLDDPPDTLQFVRANRNVIVLRNRLEDEKRRRTVEILKLRGTSHQKGEFPFTVLSHEGIVVIPLSGWLNLIALINRFPMIC